MDAKFFSFMVISVTLTVALTFSTLRVVQAVNELLYPSFPDVPFRAEDRERLLSVAWPIGYACFGLVVLLIILGFLMKHTRLTSIGTLAVFLPTFGEFAVAMFFLAGLGILRVVWLPIRDCSPTLFRLGDVVYLPYWAIGEAAYSLCGSNLAQRRVVTRVFIKLPYIPLAVGFLVFFVGIFTWFHDRLEKRDVLSRGIYKCTRHPQYLGFILWSYGILLFSSLEGGFWGGSTLDPSFTWVISTLLIICVALAEEAAMLKQTGDAYRAYREQTPFMIPLPRVVARLITIPHRVLLRKSVPENLKEILAVFVIYTVAVATLSYLVYLSGIMRFFLLQ